MVLLVLLGLGYVAGNGYVLLRLLSWMKSLSPRTRCKRVWIPAIGLFLVLSTAVIISGFLPGGTAIKAHYVRVGNLWYGMSLYIGMFLLTADLVRLVVIGVEKLRKRPTGLRTRRVHVIVGAVCLVLIAALTVGGTLNARAIRVKHFDLAVNKAGGALAGLTVVLASDLHMGYNIGVAHIRQMVEKINDQHPDVVVLAGDIFDNEYERLADPQALMELLGSIESKYGVYACYGNHDVTEVLVGGFATGERKKESDPRMDDFLQSSGVRLLRDEGVLIEESVYLYGRPDYKNPGRGVDTRRAPGEITADMDKTKPILVVDHQPRELAELAAAGVDVDLSGHTHDGQLFPLNIASRRVWENSCGYLNKDGMHSVVSAGVGLYGPNMRLGTEPDICVIDLHFTGG